MDEIYYIVGIDARPWKKTGEVGTAIPLVLFFASVETLRGTWNEPSVLPDFQKYFLIIVLVVFGMYLSRWLEKPWRERYTKKLILNLIYLGLISTGFSNALFLVAFTRDKLIDIQNDMMGWLRLVWLDSDAMLNVLFSVFICVLGLIYMSLQTLLHRRAECLRLTKGQPSHLFRSFRIRESRALRFVYLAYFVGAVSILSLLTSGQSTHSAGTH
jgi:hypothetical protein